MQICISDCAMLAGAVQTQNVTSYTEPIGDQRAVSLCEIRGRRSEGDHKICYLILLKQHGMSTSLRFVLKANVPSRQRLVLAGATEKMPEHGFVTKNQKHAYK